MRSVARRSAHRRPTRCPAASARRLPGRCGSSISPAGCEGRHTPRVRRGFAPSPTARRRPRHRPCGSGRRFRGRSRRPRSCPRLAARRRAHPPSPDPFRIRITRDYWRTARRSLQGENPANAKTAAYAVMLAERSGWVDDGPQALRINDARTRLPCPWRSPADGDRHRARRRPSAQPARRRAAGSAG